MIALLLQFALLAIIVSIGYVTYHSVGKILEHVLKVYMRYHSVSKKFLI